MNNYIGSQIKKIRKEKKMKRAKLAEAAGISLNYIGAIERGEKLPKLLTFIKIINALEVDANLILGNNIVLHEKAQWSELYEKIENLDAFERQRAYEILKILTKSKDD